MNLALFLQMVFLNNILNLYLHYFLLNKYLKLLLFYIFDKKQFRRIAKAFKLQGGVIQQNPETDEYLRNVAHAEGTTYNATTILLLQKPSRASVFEELIHTAQYRNGRNDGSTKSRFLNEIEAQEKLLRNAKYYKLTYPEIIQTQKALAQYKQDLEEYYRNGGE